MKPSLVPICSPGFSQPHGSLPAIRSHSANARRRKRRALGQCQFTPLQQSRVSPWHPGAGQRGAASLFKEQVIFLASLAVGAGSVMQSRTEQNNRLSSTSAGPSLTTKPSQLCDPSAKAARTLSHSAQLLSKPLDICPSLRRSGARISPVPPQGERPPRRAGAGPLSRVLNPAPAPRHAAGFPSLPAARKGDPSLCAHPLYCTAVPGTPLERVPHRGKRRF